MTELKYIDLSNDGGATTTVPLGDTVITIRQKYNYTIKCWTIDILDAEGTLLLAGLMLVPDIDILKPYPAIKELIGSLVLIEKTADDYQSAELFGTNTKLLWFAPGEEIDY
jgi:hypothetical protein